MPPEEVPPVVTPPADPPPVVAKLATPPAVANGSAPPAEPKRHKVSGDGEIPDDAEIIEMSKSALTKRLARHTAGELKKRFGTDDPDQILKDQAELKELREKEEKRRVDALSDLEKERELRTQAERRAEASEAKARAIHEERIYSDTERRIARVAEKHVDLDYLDVEMNAFSKHLRNEMRAGTFTRKQLDEMDPKSVAKLADEFFANRVKEKPRRGKDYEANLKAQVEADLKKAAKERNGGKVPVTNGAKGGKKDPPADGADDRPLGQRSKAEIKAAGYNW
jgi:hypothetical protein